MNEWQENKSTLQSKAEHMRTQAHSKHHPQSRSTRAFTGPQGGSPPQDVQAAFASACLFLRQRRWCPSLLNLQVVQDPSFTHKFDDEPSTAP